ncbi:hypothetical protein [Thioclava sp. F1Mire-8]|uniref:hypothetical protein n=1 Tax=Thioclava sp. F1Mire-8 TaxID=1973006 RepID=UPI0011BD0376|nr:hypothetical protein [Thioclava sp. F1Mire-8]
MQNNLLDRAAQDGRCFAAAIRVIERCRQIFRLAAVDLGKRRVDDDGIGRWYRGEPVLDRRTYGAYLVSEANS